MITAQDIREKTFEKSKFGGYDMTEVDDFLEQLADDTAAAQKENAVLKSKMKVLVDKIEEYRSNEEALNRTILSAQKLAVQIEADARTRAAAMIDDAEKQVRARVGSIDDLTADHQRRLTEAQASTRQYIETVRALCQKQLSKLDNISSSIIPETDTAAGSAVVPEISRISDKEADAAAPAAKEQPLENTQAFTL